MKFEWSCGCLVFYLSTLYIVLNLFFILLRLGPYSPPPAPKLWLREREWAQTKTRPPFKIFTHPSAEDRYISLELQKYGVWEEKLHLRMMDVMRDAHPDSNATFLDIGAHIGFHALAAAAAGYRAVAIEPLRYL